MNCDEDGQADMQERHDHGPKGIPEGRERPETE
jgi:hypothetical protein